MRSLTDLQIHSFCLLQFLGGYMTDICKTPIIPPHIVSLAVEQVSLLHSFVHSFTQQVRIDHSLCIQHCSWLSPCPQMGIAQGKQPKVDSGLFSKRSRNNQQGFGKG